MSYRDQSNPPPEAPCVACGAMLAPRWALHLWMRPETCEACHTAVLALREKEAAARHMSAAMTAAGIYPGEMERAREATGSKINSGVRQWCDTPRAWAWLTGGYGTGKTTQGVMAAMYYIQRQRERRGAEAPRAPVTLITEGALLEAIKRDGFDAAPYIATSRLILDEVGRETRTDWSVSTLRRIVDERYRAGRATMFISNHKLADLIASASGGRSGSVGLWDAQMLHRVAERVEFNVELTTPHRQRKITQGER